MTCDHGISDAQSLENLDVHAIAKTNLYATRSCLAVDVNPHVVAFKLGLLVFFLGACAWSTTRSHARRRGWEVVASFGSFRTFRTWHIFRIHHRGSCCRRKLERLDRNRNGVRNFLRDNGAGGGHARQELLFRILGGNHDGISYHVARGRRVQSNFLHGSVKRFVLEGVDRERDTLALLHLTNVSFVYGGHDFHLAQILCDDEQCRRAHGGGNGLADIHCSFQHNAVNRALDGGVAQIQFCLGDFVLALFHGELCCV